MENINILDAILLLLGVWFTYSGVMLVVGGVFSRKWPTTNARIIESKVKSGRTAYGSGPSTFWPVIKYEYYVGENLYTGKRIAFGKHGTKWNNTTNEDLVLETLENYKLGHTVAVHYSPALPFISVLVPGFYLGSIFILVIGIAWLSWGLYHIFPHL